MRIYEELFILRPETPEEEIDHLIEQLTTFIASQGGNVDKSDKWGIRKLAYRVQKKNEGFYVLLQFTTKPETVLEVERRLRVSDLVMKFQSVRIDEKLKKIEKRKKEREKRAARKPAPPAAPAVPLEHAMAGVGEPSGPRPGAPMPGAPVAGSTAVPAAGSTTGSAAAPVAEKAGE
jgi:small subunit ribosomal protein S6